MVFGAQSLTPAPRTEPISFPLLASHAGTAVPSGTEVNATESRVSASIPSQLGRAGEILLGSHPLPQAQGPCFYFLCSRSAPPQLLLLEPDLF